MMKTETPRTFGNSNQNGRKIQKLHSSRERRPVGKTSKPYAPFISKPETERTFQHKTTFTFYKKRKTEDNPFLFKKNIINFRANQNTVYTTAKPKCPSCLPQVCSYFQTRARWIDVFSFNFGHVFLFVMWQRHIFGPWYTTDLRNAPFFCVFWSVEYDNHVHGAYIMLCIFEHESCFSFHLRTIFNPYQYPIYFFFIRLLNSYLSFSYSTSV